MRTVPIFAAGLAPDDSKRLQAAVSRLIGRAVSDDEDVVSTVIEACEATAHRLEALERLR
jgi:hypothetical protein